MHTKEPFIEPRAPMRHSAEPWTTEAFNDIDYGDTDYSAMILAGDGESIIAQQMCDHDADRAAACVNAMQGIPDPAAYVAAMGEVMDIFRVILDDDEVALSRPDFETAWEAYHAARAAMPAGEGV